MPPEHVTFANMLLIGVPLCLLALREEVNELVNLDSYYTNPDKRTQSSIAMN